MSRIYWELMQLAAIASKTNPGTGARARRRRRPRHRQREKEEEPLLGIIAAVYWKISRHFSPLKKQQHNRKRRRDSFPHSSRPRVGS